ncbi:MAG: SH3 domain-containing protein [Thiogranum sp.]|nr:SH3 domain-containing protein [Thiogranum sp.]
MTQFAPELARALLLLTSIFLLGQKTANAEIFSRFFGDDQPIQVEIADPYIELHSGPGPGYPVFHVEERGAWIEILKRKTDWFKIRTDSGKEGWVPRHQIERTLTPSGDHTEIREATLQEFALRRWEAGIMGGDFEGADVMTAYGGFSFTPNLSVEASVSKVFADFSDADMADLSIAIHPFPTWRFSPFFTIGTGIIRSDPKTTLVQELDSTDQIAHAGAGIRVYLTRRFVFRAQYRNYVIFQSTDDNQEIDEWKAGFSVFF